MRGAAVAMAGETLSGAGDARFARMLVGATMATSASSATTATTTTGLLDRVRAFLPAMEKANKELEASAGTRTSVVTLVPRGSDGDDGEGDEDDQADTNDAPEGTVEMTLTLCPSQVAEAFDDAVDEKEALAAPTAIPPRRKQGGKVEEVP